MALVQVASNRRQKEFLNSVTMARLLRRGIAVKFDLGAHAASPIIF